MLLFYHHISSEYKIVAILYYYIFSFTKGI